MPLHLSWLHRAGATLLSTKAPERLPAQKQQHRAGHGCGVGAQESFAGQLILTFLDSASSGSVNAVPTTK